MSIETRLSGELLDITDNYGNPTGEVLDKTLIHQRGLWHRDVHVWITNGSSFLQQRRAADKSIMPDQWDISANGHVGLGEGFKAAAKRETIEELGPYFKNAQLIKLVGRIPVEMSIKNGAWVHRVVCENYVIVDRGLTAANLQDVLRLQQSEVADARLYNIDQLEADVHNPARAYLHAEHPLVLWEHGIEGMRQAAA